MQLPFRGHMVLFRSASMAIDPHYARFFTTGRHAKDIAAWCRSLQVDILIGGQFFYCLIVDHIITGALQGILNAVDCGMKPDVSGRHFPLNQTELSSDM